MSASPSSTVPTRRVRFRRGAPCVVVPLGFFFFPPLLYLIYWEMVAPRQAFWGAVRSVVYGALTAAVLAYAWGRDNRRQKRLLISGEKTVGRVCEVRARHGGFWMRVQYTFRGENHEGDTPKLVNAAQMPGIGTEVTVYVDPTSPQSFAVYETSAYRFVEEG